MGAIEIYSEYRRMEVNEREQNHFFELKFTDTSGREHLSKELSSLLLDGRFGPCHVPGLLRLVCLSAAQFQGDFWKNFLSPELSRHSDLSSDDFYNCFFRQDYKTPFFKPFEKWCNSNRFMGDSFYSHYAGENTAMWRVRLVNDQCGLMIDGDFPRCFLGSLWLDQVAMNDEVWLLEKYDNYLRQFATGDPQQAKIWRHRRELLVRLAQRAGHLFDSFHDAKGTYPANAYDFNWYIQSQSAVLGQHFADKLCEVSQYFQFRTVVPPRPRVDLKINSRSYVLSGIEAMAVRPVITNISFSLVGLDVAHRTWNVKILANGREIHQENCEGSAKHVALTRWVEGDFSFWDDLTLEARSDIHRFPKSFKWISPGLFRLDKGSRGRPFHWKRLERGLEAFQCVAGTTLLLVPPSPLNPPIIENHGIAQVEDLPSGAYKISVMEPKPTEANSFLIRSGGFQWNFVVPIPHASISITNGRVGTTNGGDGEWQRVLACRINPSVLAKVQFDGEGLGGVLPSAILAGASLVLLKGWGANAKEIGRLSLCGQSGGAPLPAEEGEEEGLDLGSEPDETAGSPSISQWVAEPIPHLEFNIGEISGNLREGEHTLRVVLGHGASCGSDLRLYLLDIGDRDANECLLVCHGSGAKAVASYGGVKQEIPNPAGWNPTLNFNWVAADGRTVRLDPAPFRLTGFKWIAGITRMSLKDFMSFCLSSPRLDGQTLFHLADNGCDGSCVGLGTTAQKDEVQLRLVNGTQGMARVCWQTDFDPRPSRQILSSILACDSFFISYKSNRVQRMEMASVNTLPVLSPGVDILCKRDGSDFVCEAVISIEARVGCVAAEISIDHWTEGNDGNKVVSAESLSAGKYLFLESHKINVKIGKNMDPGLRKYQLYWQVNGGTRRMVLEGRFFSGSLGQMDFEMSDENLPTHRWLRLAEETEWLGRELGGLLRLVGGIDSQIQGQQLGVAICSILNGADWPKRAIRRLCRFLNRHANLANTHWAKLFDLADKTGRGIGHPNNPVQGPGWYGLEANGQNATTDIAWVAVALVLAQVQKFREEVNLMHIHPNVLPQWRDVVRGLANPATKLPDGFRNGALVCLSLIA